MICRQSGNRLATASRFFLISLLLTLVATTAYGHGGASTNDDRPPDSKVRAVLDTLPPELEGLHIELRRTLAPQLLVSNPTDQTLTVYDETGRAFLRIGPKNVEGDLGASAFHRTNTLMAPGAFTADASEEPRWQTVEKTPNWGWFDLRLRTDEVAVPHAVADAGLPKPIADWSIPVEIGDTKSAIGGHFEYQPPPRGIAEARVLDAGKLGDSAVVRALTGSKRPGMFVSYRGDQPLIVLGQDDEPFLRFGTDGVETNRHSLTWKAITPAGAPAYVAAKPDADPLWARVSSGSSYGWIEPRAEFSGTVDKPGQSNVVKSWTIPVLIGENRDRIKGVTEWQPIKQRSQAAQNPGRNK